MSALRHDLKIASRLLTKNPLFTTIAIVTLALGIGLNTAVFSTIDALLLRPLPGTFEPDRLVQLYRKYPGMDYGSNSPPGWRDLQERTKDIFSDVATWDFVPVSVSADGRSERLMGEMVSANLFSVLGVSAERGRMFVAQEDSGAGAHAVAVISNAMWKGRFAADPAIVGKSITLNGAPYTIVGVAPAAFRGPLPLVTPALWVPLVQVDQIRPESRGALEYRGNNFMSVIARLKPGTTYEQAQGRIAAVAAQLQQEMPDTYQNSGITMVRQQDAGIHPTMRQAQVGLSGVVMAVVLMLLLIACVNVANLFLARARDRWREMAVRQSLGATRAVLIRQLMTESVIFSLIAGSIGLFVAWGAITLLNGVSLPFDVDFTPDVRLSPTVLLFTLAITLVTGLLFGLAPALQATRPSLVPTLKGEAPAGGRSRMSRGLVVAQMALSLVLLVSASLFLRNLRAATTVDKGFDSSNLLLASVNPALQGYDRPRTEQFYRQLIERVKSIPNVKAVGLVDQVPLGLGSSDTYVDIPGYTAAPNEPMSVLYATVAPGYFEAMGIPLLRGRDFSVQDDSTAPRGLIVNERFAQRFFKGADVVGRTLKVGRREHTILGVVPTGKYKTLGEDPTAYMYFAQAQRWSAEMTMNIRTSGNPTAIVPALRSAVSAMDPALPLADVRTMDEWLGTALLPARLTGSVLGIFGILGLLLAAVGMYGVMAYSVAQRTREIGIRMAIGAAEGQVLGLVMRQGMTLVGVGAVIGLAGALGASRLVRGLLIGGQAVDPLTFVGVPLVLIAVSALAIWVPARRAGSVNPVTAIKAE
ncbi:MAG: ABC transporter permease [Gemmatimonadaceae bacterium]